MQKKNKNHNKCRQFPYPKCTKPTTTKVKFFPFCSYHCKYSDLHGWLSGTYKISTPLKEPKIEE